MFIRQGIERLKVMHKLCEYSIIHFEWKDKMALEKTIKALELLPELVEQIDSVILDNCNFCVGNIILSRCENCNGVKTKELIHKAKGVLGDEI